MSKETAFRYYEASSVTSSTMPGRPVAAARRTSVDALDGTDSPAGISSVAVKVAAGAGDKCVAPAQSRPKRRQTIRHDSDDDTLDVRSVQWTNAPGISVSELAAGYQTQCPLLAKVTEDYADFMRGQVIATVCLSVTHARHVCSFHVELCDCLSAQRARYMSQADTGCRF